MRSIPLRQPGLSGLVAIAIFASPLVVYGDHPHRMSPPELPAPGALKITPAEFIIGGADQLQRVVVQAPAKEKCDGRVFDFSRQAVYSVSDPKVAVVSAEGVLTPLGNGSCELRATVGGQSATARLTVKDFDVSPPVSFRNQVVPVFTKLGCNSGGCHGKASGQNGFKLSLLGFDADFDYRALVSEARGRRVFPGAPERSLLVLKATGAVPHGGGRKLVRDSVEYNLLVRWLRQGTPRGSAKDPVVTRIAVYPQSAVVGQHGEQQVLVTAFYSDGTQRDVTREAQFKSNELNIAAVDDHGLIRTDEATGDTAVMARYMGQVEVCRVSIPMENAVAATADQLPPKHNYIDEFVQAKWHTLKLKPSPLCDDAAFLRRAFLDCLGTLPTPDEVRAFLADKDPKKREKAVDAILARNEYADFWALKWGDLLRNQRKGEKEQQRGTYAFHAWIRNAFATNMPYDRFVRSIIAAQGTVDQHPPVIWYRSVRNLTHQTNDTAQLFLGTRINCAQCHHHPYEKWSQDDYYQLQAFFARMGRKSGEIVQEPAIFVRPDGDVRNPATNKIMTARGLDGPETKTGPDEDPRHKLVDWMVAKDNPFFARAICNRLWGHFTGRGLVEPIDDMRVTNPPSNPELLDALARDLFEHKFDLKHLIRAIMLSSTYQLSSEPNEGNIHDQQNYARSYPRRMLAEVLLDSLCRVTGAQESFQGMPKGTTAIQLPDESIGSQFLDTFGRPVRDTACECERPREANLAQALQLLNSNDLQIKVGAPQGRLAALLKDKKNDDELIAELYLLTYGRPPRETERTAVRAYVAEQKDRKAAFEDLLWALLNTKEFLFNH
jgi:Protein of unknown function (DUF1549)/Protein of unknown function (DUF1553)